MTAVSDDSDALKACTSLCERYALHADEANADALAELYTPDGVLDRLGQRFIGRSAIRELIASRPADVWTRHVFSNIRIEIDVAGGNATGHADLLMERGLKSGGETETIRAHFVDAYVLTDLGWRFASRTVRPAS